MNHISLCLIHRTRFFALIQTHYLSSYPIFPQLIHPTSPLLPPPHKFIYLSFTLHLLTHTTLTPFASPPSSHLTPTPNDPSPSHPPTTTKSPSPYPPKSPTYLPTHDLTLPLVGSKTGHYHEHLIAVFQFSNCYARYWDIP